MSFGMLIMSGKGKCTLNLGHPKRNSRLLIWHVRSDKLPSVCASVVLFFKSISYFTNINHLAYHFSNSLKWFLTEMEICLVLRLFCISMPNKAGKRVLHMTLWLLKHLYRSCVCLTWLLKHSDILVHNKLAAIRDFLR